MLKAVVDTGPLFTMLTVNYVQVTGITDEKRRSILGKVVSGDVLRIPTFEEGYRGLFDSIGRLLTTSHVVGELQGLENGRLKLYGDKLGKFWSSALEFLGRKNVEERLVALVAMHAQPVLRDAICLVGPTDTGLVDLARKEGCALFTDDRRTLAPPAWRNGVDCRLVSQLIGTD